MITFENACDCLIPFLNRFFGNNAIYRGENCIIIDPKKQNIVAKINFIPETNTNKSLPKPTEINPGLFLYSHGSYPTKAGFEINAGVKQVIGDIVPTRYPITEKEDGTLEADWEAIATAASTNIHEQIRAQPTRAQSSLCL